ncbi:hypothetical protein AB0E85_35915, partial [Streptomyces sp. NPDC029044]
MRPGPYRGTPSSPTAPCTGRTLDGWYDIEANYDFLYTEVSTDGGA